MTAVDDSIDDDGESVELAFGRLPGGVSEGATTRAVVQITDNDGKGIDLSRTSLTVNEGGSASYTVALASQPTATVTVTITGHLGTDVSLNPLPLSFTTSDWNTAQTVMVIAAQDPDRNNDSATLIHTARGADYGSVMAVVAVTVLDDDRPIPPTPPPTPTPGPSPSGGGGGGGGSAPRNRSPSFTEGDAATRTVAENTAAGQDIGAPLVAVDPDRRDTLTYSLEGEDAASFDIDAATGQLRTKAALDYETRTSLHPDRTRGGPSGSQRHHGGDGRGDQRGVGRHGWPV